MPACTIYMSGAHGDQKGVSDPLKPELQIIVSGHVVLGQNLYLLQEQSVF